MIIFCAIVLLLGMTGFSVAAPVFVKGVTATTGWTDVNKVGDPYVGSQSNYCWAASAANMIAYTGWNGGPTLNTAPAIYNDFVAHWNNDIGNSMIGVEWWFTGVNSQPSATLRNTSHTGFYNSSPPFPPTIYQNNRTFREPALPPEGNGYGLVPTAADLAAPGFESLSSSRLGWIDWYIQKNRGISISITGNFSGGPTYKHFLTVWGVDTATNTIYVTDSDIGNNTLDSYVIDGSLYLSGYYRNFVWTALYGLFPNSTGINPTLRQSQIPGLPTILNFQ